MSTSCTTVLLKQSGCCAALIGSVANGSVPLSAAFAGLPRVTLEDPVLAARALDWRRGMDFADSLTAKAQGCEAFISFDQRFAALANALSEVKVRAP